MFTGCLDVFSYFDVSFKVRLLGTIVLSAVRNNEGKAAPRKDTTLETEHFSVLRLLRRMCEGNAAKPQSLFGSDKYLLCLPKSPYIFSHKKIDEHLEVINRNQCLNPEYDLLMRCIPVMWRYGYYLHC